MTIEQKHNISRQIVSCLQKISYYKQTVDRLKKDPKLFYEATIEIRILKVRNNIWGNLTIEQSIRVLQFMIQDQKKELTKLESKIK